MPFLCSLTYTGTRVGGQRERQTQAFESGIAYFPEDYPLTPAYQSYAWEFESNEKSRWERKPKGKRANWKKLGTRSPWRADWELVLKPNTPSNYGWEDLVPTQREEPLDDRQASRRHWLLCGSEAASILNSCCRLFYPPAGLFSEINRLRSSRNQKLLRSTQSAEALWEDALVRVRLLMFSRGTPRELAMICSLDDQEARVYRRGAGADMAEEKEESEVSINFRVSNGFRGLTCPFLGFDQPYHWLRYHGRFFSRSRARLLHWSNCSPTIFGVEAASEKVRKRKVVEKHF
jgi:ribonuclease P/MRP protein subunit POP1